MSILGDAFQLDGAQLRKLVYDGGKTLRSAAVHWQGTFSKSGNDWKLTLPSGQILDAIVEATPPTGKNVWISVTLDVPDDPKPVPLRVKVQSVRESPPQMNSAESLP